MLLQERRHRIEAARALPSGMTLVQKEKVRAPAGKLKVTGPMERLMEWRRMKMVNILWQQESPGNL